MCRIPNSNVDVIIFNYLFWKKKKKMCSVLLFYKKSKVMLIVKQLERKRKKKIVIFRKSYDRIFNATYNRCPRYDKNLSDFYRNIHLDSNIYYYK